MKDSEKKQDTNVKQDELPNVKQLDSIRFKVKDLIDKGESQEQSEIRIKKLKMILTLLDDDEKESGETSDKKCYDSKDKMEDVKDKKEVKLEKQVPIHKIEKEGKIEESKEKSDQKVDKGLQDVKVDESPGKVNKRPEKMSGAVLSICKIDKGDGKCNMENIDDKVDETGKSDVNKEDGHVIKDGKMVVGGGKGKSPVKLNKSPVNQMVVLLQREKQQLMEERVKAM